MRWPVGTDAENAQAIDHLPGAWQDINPFENRYQFGYHTGLDLVLHSPYFNAGIDQPLRAVMPGVVTFSGIGRGQTWGWIVIVRHHNFYTRTAHGDHRVFSPVAAGQRVSEGQELIPEGNADGYYGSGYHCHFDVCISDALLRDPSDWPGLDLARLQKNYTDPFAFIVGVRKYEMANPPVPFIVARTGLFGGVIPAYERDTSGGWAIVAWYKLGDTLTADPTTSDGSFIQTPTGRWVDKSYLDPAPVAPPPPPPPAPPPATVTKVIMQTTADALFVHTAPGTTAPRVKDPTDGTDIKLKPGTVVTVLKVDPVDPKTFINGEQWYQIDPASAPMGGYWLDGTWLAPKV